MKTRSLLNTLSWYKYLALPAFILLLLVGNAQPVFPGQGAAVRPQAPSPQQPLLNEYCITCHNQRMKTAVLTLDPMDLDRVRSHPEVWEKVVLKTPTGLVAPSDYKRPARAVLDAFATELETRLDRAATANPNPGTPALHRLNRTEYKNAVRDLLALDVDVSTLLPADDSSEGFDNIADA